MNEVLTWEEICEEYPGEHLGVTDIETEADGVNIKRAKVIMSDRSSSRNEILRKVSETKGAVRSVYVSRADFLDLTAAGRYADI